jgi:hypothetical protein
VDRPLDCGENESSVFAVVCGELWLIFGFLGAHVGLIAEFCGI